MKQLAWVATYAAILLLAGGTLFAVVLVVGMLVSSITSR